MKAIFFISCVILSVQGIAHSADIERKTILMFGISGVGKSTISNCLLNQKGDMKSLDLPFPACEDAVSGNLKFEVRSNKKFNIIDSIGFGSPDMNASYILDEMRGALKQVNNEIDYVFYVIKKGRLTNTTFQFINKCQEQVFQNKTKNNSALIVNMCEKGWLLKDAQKTNAFLKKILDSVNGQAYEVDLKWDHWRDDESIKLKNIQTRKKSIDEFVNFVENLEMNKINNSVLHELHKVNVSHIQTAEFKHAWISSLFAALLSLALSLMYEYLKG